MDFTVSVLRITIDTRYGTERQSGTVPKSIPVSQWAWIQNPPTGLAGEGETRGNKEKGGRGEP